VDLQQSSAVTQASQQTALEATASADQQSGAGIRLHGGWLLLARVIWLVTAALAVVFTITALPVRYNDLLSFHPIFVLDYTSGKGDLDPAIIQHGLQQLGMSAEFYASYDITAELIVVLSFLVVGAIIFWRKSDDLMAIAVSFTLVTFGASLTSSATALVVAQPGWRFAYNILSLGWTTLGLVFFALFPDGRFVPKWMRVWAVAWAVFTLWWVVLPVDSPYYPDKWPVALAGLVFGGLLAVGVYAQVYRYRFVSGPARRYQTKWVVFGLTLAFIGLVGGILPASVLQQANQPDSTKLVYDLIILPISYFCILCLPLSVGFSVLRYRLYEIDIIINRTLVYVPLTAILAGLYSASIALFQKVFVAATGEKSDAAIVITTLLLTTTFTPIKNVLQSVVDRRFKETLDAAAKLKPFDQQVRSVGEVIDTNQITRKLLEQTSAAFDATSGAVYLKQDGEVLLIHASDKWAGEAVLSIPLESDGEQLGLLQLGTRRDGMAYSPEDREVLQQTADGVAHIVRLAERAR